MVRQRPSRVRPNKREDVGGDIISVSVRRNGILEHHRDCVLSEINGNLRYKISDGDFLRVPKGSTALDVARRLLRDRGDR